MHFEDLVKQDPWAILSYLPREYHRLLGTPPRRLVEGGEPADLAAGWAPAVDIEEEDDRFVVRADLPGVDARDIEITLAHGVLTISGERGEERESEREGYRRLERFRGRFFRRFSLPDTADAENVRARSDKGVVEIVIPKTRTRQARRIEVEG